MKNLMTDEAITRTPRMRRVNNMEFQQTVEEWANEINQFGMKQNGSKHARLSIIPNGYAFPRTYAKEIQLKNDHPKMLFIVEDNAMYAKSLQYYLEDRLQDTEIRVFSLGESCIENMHLNPDHIIMDYHLNSKEYNALDGLNTIRTIRKKNINSKIIILSSQLNMDVTVEAVKFHHCNYVVKNERAFEKVYTLMKENR